MRRKADLKMCRIALIISGNNDKINDVIAFFIKASQYDPYKLKISRKRDQRHPHGWGFLLFTYTDKYLRQFHYRSIKPVYNDYDGVQLLKNIINDESYKIILLHSRAASHGKTNLFNTHPFHFSGKGYQYWIAHNGTMNINLLFERLGMKKREFSDSYLLGRLIYELINYPTEDSIIKSFREAVKYTRTAMNTVNIFYSVEQQIIITVTSYISNNLLKKKEYVDYYKLLYRTSNNELILGSSTVIDYLKLNNTTALVNKALIINVSADKIATKSLDL